MNIGVIPARLNSKRFPKKILTDINGKPMVVTTAEQVSKCKSLDKVIIAIDSDETYHAIKKYGFEMMMTSINHKSGTDRVAEVVNKLNDINVVVNVQADEPFINPTVIDNLVYTFNDSDTEMSTLVSTQLSDDDLHDSNIVKAYLNEELTTIDFHRESIDTDLNIYKHLGIYAFNKNTLLKFVNLKQSENEKDRSLEQMRALDNNIKIKSVITEEDSFSINVKSDLDVSTFKMGKTMKEGLRKNIQRKQPAINDVVMHNGFPLFSFLEININELCNRTCPFCPRHDPKVYPNQNLHMDIDLADNIAQQLQDLNFKGIVNISGTGEPMLTKHIVEIVKSFGDRNIHVEIVTNGDLLKPKKIKDLYEAGLSQFVVSMYDGPEQVDKFNNLFDKCGIDKSMYSLRDRWYSEEEGYGLLYLNRAGAIGDRLSEYEKRPCFYPHYSIYLDWNGDMLLCCQDMYNRTLTFGNVKEKLLIDMWLDSKLMEFRNKLKKGDRSSSPCDNCDANGLIFGKNHAQTW